MKSKGLLVVASLLVTNLVFASPVTMNLSITNNSPQSWNPMARQQLDQIGPIVSRKGGTTQWALTADDTRLVQFNIIYTARGDMYTWCGTNGGVLTLNPTLYIGDTIKISVSGDIEKEALTCTCSGSACDVNFAMGKQHKVS
jgi:hypothetical protein